SHGLALAAQPSPPVRLLPGRDLPDQPRGARAAVPSYPGAGPWRAEPLAASFRANAALSHPFSHLANPGAGPARPGLVDRQHAGLRPRLAARQPHAGTPV